MSVTEGDPEVYWYIYLGSVEEWVFLCVLLWVRLTADPSANNVMLRKGMRLDAEERSEQAKQNTLTYFFLTLSFFLSLSISFFYRRARNKNRSSPSPSPLQPASDSFCSSAVTV